MLRNKIYLTKRTLASKIAENQDVITSLTDIIESKGMTRNAKINAILNVIRNLKDYDKESEDEFVLKYIANEMLNDNINNPILTNTVVLDYFDINQIVKRDSESVLLNLNDIQKWTKKYKSESDVIDTGDELTND